MGLFYCREGIHAGDPKCVGHDIIPLGLHIVTETSADGPEQQIEHPRVPEELLARIQQAVAPRYRLTRLLGRGGMAWVFLAQDLSLSRSVAIKVVVSLPSDESGIQERFRREALLAASLAHPHIVPVYEVGESNSVAWFAMQYVDGSALDAVLRTERRIDPLRVRALLADVADALSYAHKRGIIHRDVKPGNIMIDADERVFVTDFGIARVADVPGLTTTGGIIGTPLYMSPEQFNGQALTPSVDQYALGCVGFELLTGRPPYPAGDVSLLLRGHLLDTVPCIKDLVPDVPVDLALAVERMLAKLPTERFESMDELASRLHNPSLAVRQTEGVAATGTRRRTMLSVAGVLSIVALSAWALTRSEADSGEGGTVSPPAEAANTPSAETVDLAAVLGGKHAEIPSGASVGVGSRPGEDLPIRAAAEVGQVPAAANPVMSAPEADALDLDISTASAASGDATVFIGSRLRGSLVFVDGRLVFSLPDVGLHPITVLPGARRISVRLDECDSVDTLLTFSAGDTIRLNRRTPRCQ